MATSTKIGLLATFVLLSAAAGAQAKADPPRYAGGCLYALDRYFSQGDRIPYFALHPPVYYSLPVPRSYGYGPFAYPPEVMTPEVDSSAGKAAEIINPYVPSEPEKREAKPAAAERVAVGSKMKTVANPFVPGSKTASIE